MESGAWLHLHNIMDDFEWQSLTALNQSPTVWRGLTINELLICVVVCAGTGIVLSVFTYMLALSWIVVPLTVLIAILLLFYPCAWCLGRYKKKYGDKMYLLRIKKRIQLLGLFNFNLETDTKKWSVRRTNKW